MTQDADTMLSMVFHGPTPLVSTVVYSTVSIIHMVQNYAETSYSKVRTFQFERIVFGCCLPRFILPKHVSIIRQHRNNPYLPNSEIGQNQNFEIQR